MVNECPECGSGALRWRVEDVPLSSGSRVVIAYLVCEGCGECIRYRTLQEIEDALNDVWL